MSSKLGRRQLKGPVVGPRSEFWLGAHLCWNHERDTSMLCCRSTRSGRSLRCISWGYPLCAFSRLPGHGAHLCPASWECAGSPGWFGASSGRDTRECPPSQSRLGRPIRPHVAQTVPPPGARPLHWEPACTGLACLARMPLVKCKTLRVLALSHLRRDGARVCPGLRSMRPSRLRPAGRACRIIWLFGSCRWSAHRGPPFPA